MKVAGAVVMQRDGSSDEADFTSEEELTHMTTALHDLGHEVSSVDFSAPLAEIAARIGADDPDVIFNTVEQVRGEPRPAGLIPTICRALGRPCTGPGPRAITIGSDKWLTKRVASAGPVPFARDTFVSSDRPLDLEACKRDVRELNLWASSSMVAMADDITHYDAIEGYVRPTSVAAGESALVRVSTEHTGSGRRHRGNDGNVSVSYRVKVPKGTDVEIQSVSGSVILSGVEGTANAQSVSGDVRVDGVADLVQAKSVSGDVEVLRARSSRHAEIESVSGEVLVRGIDASELTVSSVSGDVLLQDVTSKRASLESVSGNLEYTGAIAASGRYNFSAHSGDVILTIGDDVGFELEASTFSGEIESDFALMTTSRAQKGKRLSAVVGDGSAFIEASTFSGDVRLVRR
jgi:hypothetical protein